MLWELPLGSVGPLAGQRVELEPALPPEALRPELEALLRDGAVLLYELENPEQSVPLDDAVSGIADDGSWRTLDKGGKPWALALTPIGEAEYLRDYPPSRDKDSY
ncbi:MAG: hypothetical protein WKF41_14000 [Gaiellaceae bacterium]